MELAHQNLEKRINVRVIDEVHTKNLNQLKNNHLLKENF